jgi:hypothetical protein
MDPYYNDSPHFAELVAVGLRKLVRVLISLNETTYPN